MDAHGINVLNKADRDHIVVRITDDLQFQFFPAKDRFFHKHLAHQTGLQASGADRLQFFPVVHQAAAGAAHGIGRTQHHRIAQFFSNGKRFVHAVRHLASRHLDAQRIHGILKLDPVLAPLDGVHLDPDHLYLIFFQDTCLRQFCAQVQSGLTSQVRQQRVRAFFGNDLFQPFHIQRFYIGHIRCLRIRHDRGRIGINQYNLISQLPQRLARLGAGIVKLTGLSDDDRAGSYDQYFVNICSLWHSPLLIWY